jgi:hypothetical protein
MKKSEDYGSRVQTKFTDLDLIFCHYGSSSPYVEIVKISYGCSFCLERTIYPLQQIFFDAPVDAVVEIYTCEFAVAVLSDRISCQELQIVQPSNVELISRSANHPELLTGCAMMELISTASLLKEKSTPKPETHSLATLEYVR